MSFIQQTWYFLEQERAFFFFFCIHCRQAAVILGEKEKERDREKETKGLQVIFLTDESCFCSRREDNDRPEWSNAEIRIDRDDNRYACARSLSLSFDRERCEAILLRTISRRLSRIPCQEIPCILPGRSVFLYLPGVLRFPSHLSNRYSIADFHFSSTASRICDDHR